MGTVGPDEEHGEYLPEAFAVWITGLPASGKSTLAQALTRRLRECGVEVDVLESDVLRRLFAGELGYDDRGRDVFYAAMTFIGSMLTLHGISIIFDATASRRIYRDNARLRIPRFIEVYVECPMEVCVERDPKGLYRRAREGQAPHAPGAGAVYEPPENPDIVIRGDVEDPEAAALRVVDVLRRRGFLA